MRPEAGRAKRYAQCVFVDMNAFERTMPEQRIKFVRNLAKLKPSGDNIKTLKNR